MPHRNGPGIELLADPTRRRIIALLAICARRPSTIAAELGLSSHTVRDHVKAIFDKAGVSSRGELVARLFSEHLLSGFERAARHVG